MFEGKAAGRNNAVDKQAFRDGQLNFHGDLKLLAQTKTFAAWLRPLCGMKHLAPIRILHLLPRAPSWNSQYLLRTIELPIFAGTTGPARRFGKLSGNNWWLQGMMGGTKAHYDYIKAFSETDVTEDLKKMDIPTLIKHGDDDQIAPVANAALKSAKILKRVTLKVYPRLPHGMCTTNPEQIKADLPTFVKGQLTRR